MRTPRPMRFVLADRGMYEVKERNAVARVRLAMA